VQGVNYVGGRSAQREQDRMMVLELRHVEALAEFMVSQALIIRDQRHDRDDGELTHFGAVIQPCPGGLLTLWRPHANGRTRVHDLAWHTILWIALGLWLMLV
jgi:hypothetical protein